MASADIDVLVVGAGVVGLGCACAIAERGFTACVLERHDRPGMETSTHNSGVIHAGIYYPAGTLKARLCVEGRELLYEFCERHGVPHRRSGKLIVASEPSEEAVLDRLLVGARENGVTLEPQSSAAVARMAPGVAATAALLSRATGIVSAEDLIRRLRQLALGRDIAVLTDTAPVSADGAPEAIVVDTGRERIAARVVVNAAGLYADEVSALFGGERFTIYPCRGEYAELAPSARASVPLPIYPVPDPSGHGLGVHLTPTTLGSVLIGPTIRYQARKDDYEHDRMPLEAFVEPTRRLLPHVTIGDLREGGTGIRAKLHPPEESFADFMIRVDRHNPRLVHAAGIDSPGLTACLAIGAMVGDIVDGILA